MVFFVLFLENTTANVTRTTTTTTIIARSTGKASDFGGVDEVAEGEELAEDEEEGVFEGDDEGVWDPEDEDELEVATTVPFTILALMNWAVPPVPCG